MSQNCAARLDPTTSLNLLKSEILTSGTTYIHPLGPFAGKELVENLLVFDDIKLSLSADSDPRYMILQQNIEYNINVEITPLRSLSDQDSYLLDSKVFSFPELQFTAVRRYRKQ
ncbi:MAG: T-box transcription factor tbx20 [Marteilia pararefringens]